MARRNSPLAVLIIGVIFIAAGYYIAFAKGWPILENARASSSWPAVAATVESSQVSSHRNSDGKTMYQADVNFSYQVDGRPYRSNTVWFGGQYSSSDSAEQYETVNRYPAGTKVEAFYNPQQPHISVLEPGTKISSYMLFGFGMVFFCVGVGLLGFPLLKLIVVLVLAAKSN